MQTEDDRPVVARLLGGLGNQMFQYAAGLELARVVGGTLWLDTRALRSAAKDRTTTPRRLELLELSIGAHLASAEMMENLRLNWRVLPRKSSWIPNRLWSVAQRLTSAGRPPSIYVYKEPSLDFDVSWPRESDARAGAYLIGHWQSEQYFSGVRDQLRSEFLPLNVDPGLRENFDEIRSQRSLAVHIRRGDYLPSGRTQRIHGVLNADYYSRAITTISERTAIDAIYVFTDDGDLGNLGLGSLSNARVISGRDFPMSPASHMFLMSAASAFVIANSSFSWWSAWLSGAPGRLIAGPSPWFTHRPPLDGPLPASWTSVPWVHE